MKKCIAVAIIPIVLKHLQSTKGYDKVGGNAWILLYQNLSIRQDGMACCAGRGADKARP